jgi:uncharacterized protein (PEP-CTERM system associated)
MASRRAGLGWLGCVATALAVLWGAAVQAGDWKIAAPRLTVSETYSDNVDLESDGESDWITEISPSISASRQGGRARASLSYSAQGLLYAKGTESNHVNHNLNANANVEMVEQLFFLDANSRVGQAYEDLTGPLSTDAAVGSDNLTTYATYSVSPYIKRRLASYAEVEARYTHSGVFYDESDISNRTGNRFNVSASSGAYFFPLSWNARYYYDLGNYSDEDDRDSQAGSIDLGYRLSQDFSLVGGAGMEKNDYSGVDEDNEDYSYWNVGVAYTPGRRFSVEARYNFTNQEDRWTGRVTFNPTLRTTLEADAGLRSFGRSYGSSISHRTRRSHWSVRYNEDLTDQQRQTLFPTPLTDIYECNGFLIALPAGTPAPEGCEFLGTDTVSTLADTDEVFISRNLTGVVSYATGKSTVTLTAYQREREFETGDEGDDITRGVRLSLSHRPAAKTTATISAGVSQVEFEDEDRTDDLWDVRLVLTRRFQTKLSGSLELRHQERDSDINEDSYEENALTARVNMTF